MEKENTDNRGWNKIYLTGERFGKLKVIEEVESLNNKDTYWKCICDCGNEHVVNGRILRSGASRSCGCMVRDYENRRASKRNKSGVTGVSWQTATEKWVASIGYKGKSIQLGRFSDKQDAIDARKEAEEKYGQS